MHRTRRYRPIVPLLLLALLCLRFPFSAAASDQDARILDVRWRLDGEATAVTLRLSAPVRYRAFVNGTNAAVDLWTVAGGAEAAIPVDRGVVADITLRRMNPDVVRLGFNIREPARFKIFRRDDLLTVVVFPHRLGAVPLPQSVAYQTLRVATGSGRARAHVVTLDLRAGDVVIRAALGGAVVSANETTSATAARLAAFAAINGNFYTGYWGLGLPLGLIVVDGQVLSAPLPRRSVFALDANDRPWIGSIEFSGRLRAETADAVPISAINRPPRWGGVVLYTPEFGPLTPSHALLIVVRDGKVGEFRSGRVAIPLSGYVLATGASERHLLLRLRRGQIVKLDLGLSPPGIWQAIQGGPQLVRNGEIHIPYAWEGFGAGFYRIRTARSAIGITRGGKVLFVTVDARSRGNSGMNLPELAALMQRLGAWDAMNLDGGGSATLVVGGRVVNALPNGGERTVASVLVAVRRPAESSP